MPDEGGSRHWLAGVLAMILTSAAACAPTEKSAYSVFRPTPRHLMRPMSTDRPDVTESARSVDAGHVQVEMSFLDVAFDDHGGVRTTTFSVMPANLKLGLLNDVDLQLVLTPYVRERTEDDEGGDDTIDGFGDDTQLRVKMNLWGNDGPELGLCDTALAVMPFVKFPTGSGDLSNDHVEAGLIVPFAAELPADFGLGIMAELDLVWNDASREYGADVLHTLALSRDGLGLAALGGFVEYIGVALDETDHTYQTLLGGGLTYGLSDDWVLDCAVTGGISEGAPDVGGIVGTSFRY